MKLLIVTSIKECREQVAAIFREVQISVFSVNETTGFKDGVEESLLDNWFSSGKESVESVFTFSFTTAEKAAQAVSRIVAYNRESGADFPIRAFVLPVEQSSYQL